MIKKGAMATFEQVMAENLEMASSEQLSLSTCLDPLKDDISSLELLRVAGSDLDVVNAARVSHGKIATEITDKDRKLIDFLAKYDHTSPFEHNQLSFRVKAPIFVVRQWMRHRMNSYNEISYRYVKSALEFYTPAHWRYQDTRNHQSSIGAFSDEELLTTYKKALQDVGAAYEHLLNQGVAREQARGLLPLCTYTEFIFTCNLHSLVHFLRLRLPADAQYEIRCYAQGMLALAHSHFPVSLDAWQKKFNW